MTDDPAFMNARSYSGKITNECEKMNNGRKRMKWYVVGYHDATGYRTVLPVAWETREKAERAREVAQFLVAAGFRLVVEEADEC
jgi:hypothetical protein